MAGDRWQLVAGTKKQLTADETLNHREHGEHREREKSKANHEEHEEIKA